MGAAGVRCASSFFLLFVLSEATPALPPSGKQTERPELPMTKVWLHPAGKKDQTGTICKGTAPTEELVSIQEMGSEDTSQGSSHRLLLRVVAPEIRETVTHTSAGPPECLK